MRAHLFLFWTSKKVLDEPGSFARAEAWRRADRIGALSLRGGAAWATLEAGGSLVQLSKSGQCYLSVFQPYLDPGREERQGMAASLIEASDEANRPH